MASATAASAVGLPSLSRASRSALKQQKKSSATVLASGLRQTSATRRAAQSYAGHGSMELVAAAGGGGGSRVVMNTGAYICRDCGYIYNAKKPTFEKLPDDYRCPVCSAPKRRFKPYADPVARNANDTSVRKARKAQAKELDISLGTALPVIVILIIAGLIATLFFLESQY